MLKIPVELKKRNSRFWTLIELLFSFDQDMRVEKTLIQTLTCQLSSSCVQSLSVCGGLFMCSPRKQFTTDRCIQDIFAIFLTGREPNATPHAMHWALSNSIVSGATHNSTPGLPSALLYGESSQHSVGGSGSAAAAASGMTSAASASESSSAIARSHYNALNSASALARLFATLVREVRLIEVLSLFVIIREQWMFLTGPLGRTV